MKKILITAVKCMICWAVSLGVCIGLLLAVSAVPSERLRGGLEKSSESLAVSDPHGMTVQGAYNSISDNYADAVLLGIAANMHGDIRSVINTRYYCDDFGPALGIRASLAGYEPNTDYTRYWHGSLVLIMPLLALTDIGGIRVILSAVMLILLAADCVLLWKKSRAVCVIFAVSAFLTHIWFVCTTLEYMPVYIIMLAVLPLYLKFSEDAYSLAVLSAAVGTVTAFSDFLTTEIMTLFVPITAVLLIKRPDEKKSTELTAGCSASWLGGYVLTFIVKWAAASAVTGNSISAAALSSAEERIGGLPDGINSHFVLLFSSVGANLSMLSPTGSKIDIMGIVVWMIIFVLVCVFLKTRSSYRRTAPKILLFIAAVPLMRYSVLMNHSFLHNYFTYRSLMISIMAMLGYVWFKEEPHRKLKK